MIVASGRTQTAEEYFETIRDFMAWGYSVAIMDWQGQGGSYRIGDDRSRQHSNGFQDDIDDFALFLDKLNAVDEFQKLPRVLFAHSMGGNISLRYLADHPEAFKCGIIVAPMLGIKMHKFLDTIAGPVLKTVNALNMFEKHAPGQSEWSETIADIAMPFLSSDPERRVIQKYWYLKNPELQCGGVTFGWVKEAFNSIDILKSKDVRQNITTPLFIAVAEKDMVVCNTSTQEFAAKVPNATSKIYAGSQHVIQAEKDDIRKPFMADVKQYVEKHLSL